MADHNKPTVTSLYANFVAELDARLDDLALMLDPARTAASNIPTGAIRWDSASSKWQVWSGTAWGNLAATYAINALTASSAAKWTTARTLALSGDVTGSTTLDGSANKTITATLSNTGVTAGTYKSVTVDAKGRVTGGTNPTTLAGYGITNAVPSADVAQVPAASKIVKSTADGPIDLGWLDTSVARELRMLAVGVNPSLDLDFGRQNYRRQNGAKGLVTLADPFASFITFTRSTGATYMGADGLLKAAAINEPRIEYGPVTGECKGLLIEESRANLLTYSEALDNAVWAKTRASIIANASVAPDGTTTADKLVANQDNLEHYINQNISPTSPGAWHTLSIYAKQAEITSVRLRAFSSPSTENSAAVDFRDMTTVSVSALGGAEIGDTSIAAIGNGWYKLSMTFKFNTLDASMLIRVLPLNGAYSSVYAGDGTSGLYIWGAQLEVGSFPTSYIKTEASAVTRGADNASVTGANFSSWYRQDEGSILYESSRQYSVPSLEFPRVITLVETPAVSEISGGFHTNSVAAFVVRRSSVDQAALYMPAVDLRRRQVGGYVKDNIAASLNGSPCLVDMSADIPSPTFATIGRRGNDTNFLNGHISRITYWPKRLTNTQLQELSK